MRLEPVVLLQRHGVEAAVLAHHRERRLEPGQRLDRRARADELVVVEDDVLVEVDHRDDRVREAALGLAGGRGALLRADGVRVHVVAGEALDGRDQVRADALRHEGRVVVGLRVHRPGAAVGAHRHARHRLDATREHEVLPAGGDLLGGDVDRLQARRAEAVELHARHRVRQPRLDRRGLGDVRALIADRRDAAEDHVVDAVRIKLPVAGEHLVHQPDDEIDGLGRVQRPVALAFPAGRANCVEYQCFRRCHADSPLKMPRSSRLLTFRQRDGDSGAISRRAPRWSGDRQSSSRRGAPATRAVISPRTPPITSGAHCAGHSRKDARSTRSRPRPPRSRATAASPAATRCREPRSAIDRLLPDREHPLPSHSLN